MRETRLIFLILFLSTFIVGGLIWVSTAWQPDPVRTPKTEPTGVPPAARTPVKTIVSPDDEDAKTDESEPVARSEAVDTSAGLQDELFVRGSIKTEYGDVVPSESVELYSASSEQRYTAVSTAHGELVFSSVAPASDYRVTVSPQDNYKNYVRRGLAINADNSSFEIHLEVLRTGLLHGQVTSPQGRPVPGFRLWIRSQSKDQGIRNVLTDSAGFFQVEAFPEGPFEVTSRVVPLRITGLMFEPEASEPIALVVDHGPHRLTGRVFDRHGRPVEGTTVILHWIHDWDGKQSTVYRRTLTDSTGTFTMEDLAYGKRELVVYRHHGSALKRGVVVGEAPADIALYLDQW